MRGGDIVQVPGRYNLAAKTDKDVGAAQRGLKCSKFNQAQRYTCTRGHAPTNTSAARQTRTWIDVPYEYTKGL